MLAEPNRSSNLTIAWSVRINRVLVAIWDAFSEVFEKPGVDNLEDLFGSLLGLGAVCDVTGRVHQTQHSLKLLGG
jgi:hypothetical protein